MDRKKTVEKWYKALGFSSSYDAQFYDALNTTEIEDYRIDKYDLEETDGKKNFLAFLYMCEALSDKYKEKGIPSEILFDTLTDIKKWLNTWSELKGGLYLGEIHWLKKHLGMNLFKLGRLQFAFGTSGYDVSSKNLKKGDNILEIHIPAVGPLKKEECEESIEMAKEFFKKYYPEYEYKFFTCHSWLMNVNLKELLKGDSNILKFQSMFEISDEVESYDLLRYVFKWNTRKENINCFEAVSGFAKKVKDRVNEDGKFYNALGIIEA